jgi:hypothetical protein
LEKTGHLYFGPTCARNQLECPIPTTAPHWRNELAQTDMPLFAYRKQVTRFGVTRLHAVLALQDPDLQQVERFFVRGVPLRVCDAAAGAHALDVACPQDRL